MAPKEMNAISKEMFSPHIVIPSYCARLQMHALNVKGGSYVYGKVGHCRDNIFLVPEVVCAHATFKALFIIEITP